MEGMWSETFPASDSASPARYKRCLICDQCNRSCRLFTSSTQKNPGRQFYKCAFDHATFFKWADEVKPHELIQVPHCGGCSAGICRVERVTTGPSKDRILFLCRVKEGEGSCGYRVWQDELQKSEDSLNLFQARIADCNGTSDTVADMHEDSMKRDERRRDHVSTSIEPSDDLTCHEVTSQMMNHEVASQTTDHEVILKPLFLKEPEAIPVIKCLEDKSNKTSRRPHKRSRYGDIIASGFPIPDSFLTVCLALNTMSTRHHWMTNAISRNLSTELNGWWGRLVFHPTPCLTTYALKPSISSVSYPLEFIFVVQGSISSTRNSRGVESYGKHSFNPEQHHNPLDSTNGVQDEILVNSSDAITLGSSHLVGAESYSRPLISQGQPETSLPISRNEASPVDPLSTTGTQGVMSNSISYLLTQAAECLQSKLLTLLETMDVKDHEAMSHAAEAAFAALDCLLFDHEDLKKRAKELIHCAKSLVEIEQSTPENGSYQKLAEHCCNEKVNLDEIQSVHDEAAVAVTNTKKRLEVMQEEISSTMDWLFQLEDKVSCCEVKMKNFELELDKIAKKKEVLELKYLRASKEVEDSQKLLEQKEAEHFAAKAAFERARALLRG